MPLTKNQIEGAAATFAHCMNEWAGLDKCKSLNNGFNPNPLASIKNTILESKNEIDFQLFKFVLQENSFDELFDCFLEHYIKTKILGEQSEVELPAASKGSTVTNRHTMFQQLPNKPLDIECANQNFKSPIKVPPTDDELDIRLAEIAQTHKGYLNCFILAIDPGKSQLINRITSDLKNAGITVPNSTARYGARPDKVVADAINMSTKFVLLATPALKNFDEFDERHYTIIHGSKDRIKMLGNPTKNALPIILEGNQQTAVPEALKLFFMQDNLVVANDGDYPFLLESILRHCLENSDLSLNPSVSYSNVNF